MIKKLFYKNKGFTLVELMVSLAIFAFMTAFLVAKYGTFNQGILLTNLAYEVALTIRNAQSYGLNVKSRPVSESGSVITNYSTDFGYPYGVHFATGAGNDTKMIFFVDIDRDGLYDSTTGILEPISESLSTYNIKRGSYISAICVPPGNSNNCNNTIDILDVTFKRPDPNAIIKSSLGNQDHNRAEITIRSTDGGTRKVIVRRTGQISVEN